MKNIRLNHWRVQVDAQQIVWLTLDRDQQTTNTINQEVLEELDTVLQKVESSAEYKGLIFASAKSSGFIAGADIKYISQLADEIESILDFVKQGQTVLTRLANVSLPTVVMIDGFCLGGGLELALACRYRVVTDNRSTKLGLPEVLLGIQPAWGGSVRLPRLVGGMNALNLLLAGKLISARAAYKIGLVNAVVPRRQLERTAIYHIVNPVKPKQLSLKDKLLNMKWCRQLIASYSRRKLQQRVDSKHYPAPYQLVDQWEQYGAMGEEAFTAEVKGIRTLLTANNTPQNLIRVFFLRERLNSFAKGGGQIKHVHVVGAGVMGGDIAAWCAAHGMQVTLQDQEPAKLSTAMQRAHRLFKKKFSDPYQVQAAVDRLLPDVDGHGIKKADIIIEAIFENLEVKQALFERLEKEAREEAILATNTSSFPLDEINVNMQSPERLVGIHFFNPVAKMQLVEVVRGAKTDSAIYKRACQFVGDIKRSVLPVLSSPGFLINRILMPYLLEAFLMYDEGVAIEKIDRAATDFGMLMGPIELADTVGLDVCLAVADSLVRHYDFSASYNERVKAKVDKLVNQGYLGKKAGRGFYRYNKKGRPIKSKSASDLKQSTELGNRLILRMVNEATACLREQIVADADLIDAGMIFGAGFAPFRGGPMHYADSVGMEELKDLFKVLATQHGERFKSLS